MSSRDPFGDTFTALKRILQKQARKLVVVVDQPGHYYLDTEITMKNGKPLFFGAVQTKKNYVSYHLMPVYVFPDLLNDMSPELRKRMQGKSCFNFKEPDRVLFRELDGLTKRGFKRFAQGEGIPGLS
jgi:hypothetical protein